MDNNSMVIEILSRAPGIFLIVVVALIALFVLMRRSPFLVMARMFHAVSAPVAKLLRALKIVPNTTGGAKSPVTMTTGFTPTAGAVFARLFNRETETERALGDISKQALPHLTLHRGALFKWLEPQEGLINAARSEQGGDVTDFQKAKHFFSYDIPVRSNPQSLFEDIYGAMIVDQFNESDRTCLYVLYEMRRIINDNVRTLSVLFSSIVAIIFVINIFLFLQHRFCEYFGTAPGHVAAIHRRFAAHRRANRDWRRNDQQGVFRGLHVFVRDILDVGFLSDGILTFSAQQWT
ncbi:MAG: hypothetical protein HC850_05920 [Rhodomicrobium sp.]|nr:hypothetical protein [Rhodomicrobium sp.]